MEYKNLDGQHILVRLDPDEEVIASLLRVAQREQVDLGMVQGIGALKKVTMGAYHVDTQAFHGHTFEGVYEMLSLSGTIDTMQGEPYQHLHIVVGDDEAKSWGGHLKEAVVSATAEIIITKLPGNLDRVQDPKTGLNIWQLGGTSII